MVRFFTCQYKSKQCLFIESQTALNIVTVFLTRQIFMKTVFRKCPLKSFCMENVRANNVNEFLPKNFVNKNIVPEKICHLSIMQRHAMYKTKLTMRTANKNSCSARRLISGKRRMHSKPSAGLSKMYYSTLISLILPGTLQFKPFIKSKSDQLPR